MSESREEFEKRNPVPDDAKWSDRKLGYYWLQYPGVTHPFDNDWMIWQEACEWQADHARRVDAGPASDIEQRLRDAHPISHQRASGSNILLEAADAIARLQSELTAARDEVERLRGQYQELLAEKNFIGRKGYRALILRKQAEAIEEMASKVREGQKSNPEVISAASIYEGLLSYACKYRTQADELENNHDSN